MNEDVAYAHNTESRRKRPHVGDQYKAFLLFLPQLSGQHPLSGHYQFIYGWLLTGIELY